MVVRIAQTWLLLTGNRKLDVLSPLVYQYAY